MDPPGTDFIIVYMFSPPGFEGSVIINIFKLAFSHNPNKLLMCRYKIHRFSIPIPEKPILDTDTIIFIAIPNYLNGLDTTPNPVFMFIHKVFL